MPSLISTHETISAIVAAVAGRSSHVERYLKRVDERLAELPNDACRRGFLGDEQAKWIGRYSEFSDAVLRGFEPGEVTAWDYVDTISELDLRRAKYPVSK